MWGRGSVWGLRDFPSSNPRFLYFSLNSPPLLPCDAFQTAAVSGQCLCLSGSGQVYPGLGEVEVSFRRWVQFWRLHWRRGLGGLGSFPESRHQGVFMASCSLHLGPQRRSTATGVCP